MDDQNSPTGFSHIDGPEPRQSILFNYAPEKYWEKIRLIVRKDVEKN